MARDHYDRFCVKLEFARDLERELNESKAETEDLIFDLEKSQAEVERLSKLMEDCLNVIRVYCPTYYNDAMERFNPTNK